jgi:uncharacterized protein with NRDE domain
MCLIIIAYKVHPKYPLILISNRDEFYDRPTAPAQFWKEHPMLLAGKDLKYGGTWLGITKKGRIGTLTNFRSLSDKKEKAPSRGILLRNLLTSQNPLKKDLGEITNNSKKHNGFNLIAGDTSELFWFSNRGNGAQKLGAGIYGLSNHLLDTPWPKVIKGKERLKEAISEPKNLSTEVLFKILADTTQAEESKLPKTGMSLEWEKALSSLKHPNTEPGVQPF